MSRLILNTKQNLQYKSGFLGRYCFSPYNILNFTKNFLTHLLLLAKKWRESLASLQGSPSMGAATQCCLIKRKEK